MADERLQILHQDISRHLERIAKLFKREQGVKITLVVRMPKVDDGGVLLTDDDLDLAIAEVKRLAGKEIITPSPDSRTAG